MARPRSKAAKPQLDVAAVINAPVKVTKQGKQRRMPPFELELRAQVKKALKDKSLPAIKRLLAIARTYDLIKPAPPSREGGGVLVVPGHLDPPAWERLFAPPDGDTSK